MADPLSIVAGVVGLLGSAYQVGAELKKFHDGVLIVESTIEGLLQDVAGLTQVLEAMQETFENITAEFGTTGNVASHLHNVARSLADGKDMLGQLEGLLREVNKTKRFLDGPRKRLRLNFATDQIASYRQHIKSYSQALQLSMQIMLFQNQMHHQRSTDQLLPGLDSLHQEVRRVGIEMNQRIKSLRATMATSNNESQVIAMVNLRDCVKSAASIVSSASTVNASEQGAKSPIAASDFGDVFPVDDNVMLQRWMETRTSHEDDEDHRSEFAPRSVASIADFGDSGSEADSDVDLEIEMAEGLFKTANVKFAEGDWTAAERLFRNCLSTLLNRPRNLHPTNGSKTAVMEVEVLQKLSDLYVQQSQWSEARQVITQKLVVQSRISGKQGNLVLHDVVRLASLAELDGAFVEAQLQARRALKGYKKVRDDQGIESCLVLLVSVSKTDGKDAEHEAYSAMLAAHRNKPLVMQEETPPHSTLPQKSPRVDARSTLPSARRHKMKMMKSTALTNNEMSSIILPRSDARPTSPAGRLWPFAENEPSLSGDESSMRQKDLVGQDGMNHRDMDSSMSTIATAGRIQMPGHEIAPATRTNTFDSQDGWEDEVLDISGEAAYMRSKAKERANVTDGEVRAEAESTWNLQAASTDISDAAQTSSLVPYPTKEAAELVDPIHRLNDLEVAGNEQERDESSSADAMGESVLHNSLDEVPRRTPESLSDHLSEGVGNHDAVASSSEASNKRAVTPQPILEEQPPSAETLRLGSDPSVKYHTALRNSLFDTFFPSGIHMFKTKTTVAQNHDEDQSNLPSDFTSRPSYTSGESVISDPGPRSHIPEVNPPVISSESLNAAPVFRPGSARLPIPSPDGQPSATSHDSRRDSMHAIGDSDAMLPEKGFSHPSPALLTPGQAVIHRKIVIVGDPATGKTCLLGRQTKGVMTSVWSPTVLNTIPVATKAFQSEQPVTFDVQDTSGMGEYDRLRALVYPDVDLVLICFSIDDSDSLSNIEEKWISEVLHFCPNVPILLVGLKADLRDDVHRKNLLRERGRDLVSPEETEDVRRKINAVLYLECSALTGKGVEEVFAHAAHFASLVPGQRKRLSGFRELFRSRARSVGNLK